jgi:hypothetical protein
VRFSVRGLIVLVLLIGGGLGWMVREAHMQRDAVAAVVKAGGTVLYDWRRLKVDPGGSQFELRVGNSISEIIPWASGWLADRIGVDYFGHVRAVWLPKSPTANDATLARVGRLTQLEELEVHVTSVSDAGLAHLKAVTTLSRLNIAGTQVTDAGLVHLKGLTNLSVLSLGGTRVTDAGLHQLKRLTALQFLVVRDTQVTDAGVRELSQALPGLTIVH